MRRLTLVMLAALVVFGGCDMTVARRLLMAGSGTGSFMLPRVPPTDASWSRSGSNPILAAAVAWEETAVFEPVVMLDGTTWKMWYSGGWDHPAMGYATSSDGVTWTKYASNPVYGQGGSGYANTSTSAEIIRVAGIYWAFVSGGTSTTTIRTTMRIATSADGIAWTTQSSSITIPSGQTLWGNRTVWIEGSTWYMLQEAGPTPWQIYLYTSSDGLTWSIANGGAALTTLQVHAGGAYGGPAFSSNNRGESAPKIGSTYHLWYHAAPGSGNVPTNIYHATSTDRITWTQTSPAPVLTHTGSGLEVDQVADPSLVVSGTTAYLFYDGVNNATQTAEILLATAPAVLP